ncbi:MAG: type II and III secretion system protein [Chthoniobacteraceae bacterium]
MIKPPLATLCVLAGLITTIPSSYAGNGPSNYSGDVASLADREVARRQAKIQTAEEQIAEGKKAMVDKDYEAAVPYFKTAVDNLPDAPETHSLRQEALDLFCKSSVELAKQRITEGRYQDSENLCKMILQDNYNPKYGPALTLMRRLEDPDYFNKTVTPGFVEKVEEVKKLMVEAKGYEDTGRYDQAINSYEKVLNLDPYNIAARKGEEDVVKRKNDFSVEDYNHTRSQLLYEVQKNWGLPVHKFNLSDKDPIQQTRELPSGTESISNKLNTIIIPKVEFRDATVREAVDYLQQKSVQLDPSTPKTGVNIVLNIDNSAGGGASAAPAPAAGGGSEPLIPGLDSGTAPAAGGAAAAPAGNPGDAHITLSLSNVPLKVALDYVAQQANLHTKIEPYAVSIVPVTVSVDEMFTKEYKVSPSFLSSAPSGGADSMSAPAGGGGGGFGGGGATAGTDSAGTGAQLTGRKSAKDVLESSGVTFGPGASANYIPSSSRLVVHNTQSNLDLIDTIIEAMNQEGPKQVEIESKFVEITQNNLKELSFDWILGQFNIPGSTSLFGAGGTTGIGSALSASDFALPFATSGSRAMSEVTSGLRSGNNAISSNAIDSLLFPTTGATDKAPAIFSIGGIFTDPQFQVAIRALNQAKGVDLLSAPRVTTKSGQRAVIEIIREFRYPTEFTPPQIPQNVGGGSSGSNGLGSQSIQIYPITPTTPTSFETRNTGVTLEVEPTVGPDGQTIDLNLVPQVVEFEGFINYGSPINTINPAALSLTGSLSGQSSQITLTDNVINQPIFSTRKVTTSVSIWDGQTVVLGGLMREDVQKVNDKVPGLGDLPLVGRLFRSQVEQHIKRNLVIFVTARLLNPAGEPIQNLEEKDEVVQPLPLPEDLAAPAQPEAPLYSK